MQIVIDISDKDYQLMKDGHIPFSVLDKMMNGISLPEGYGRLFDERDVYKKIRPYVNNGVLDDIMFSLTPIIIEADRSE